MPAIEGILKVYFMGVQNLRTFFVNTNSELWLHFMQAQLTAFLQAVLKIKSHNIFVTDATNASNKKDLVFKQNTPFVFNGEIYKISKEYFEQCSLKK